MDYRDQIIRLQDEKIQSLNEEIMRLRKLLVQYGIHEDGTISAGITSDTQHNSSLHHCEQGQRIIPEVITPKHAQFFYSYFKGRKDVYSKRAKKPNPKSGKTGYYTQCWNVWKPGLCPKYEKKKIRCTDCPNQRYRQLTAKAVMQHLQGVEEDCSDVIGVYPMFPDETCYFLVFDFDNHDGAQGNDDEKTNELWHEEVDALREICQVNHVDSLTERSRSGKGAHIWIFFQEPIPAKTARLFGTALLTKGAETVNQKTFRSYDRMLPAQDHLPAGGLGNLIALPLQGRALKNGNSAFIDREWNAYPNQWEVLSQTKKLSRKFVEEKIAEWTTDGALGILTDACISAEEENTSAGVPTVQTDNECNVSLDQVGNTVKSPKPWERKPLRFHPEDVHGVVHITLSNGIYIEKGNLLPRMQNSIRRLAAYSNPEYYKNLALGFSTRNNPRIIACSEDYDEYIHIPRGLYEALMSKLDDANIQYDIIDDREQGRKLKIEFIGELYPEQKNAAEKILQHDNGILHAATAFGKTAVGSFLIAKHATTSLVLVHNREILNNWISDLQKFLDIDEDKPTYTTPTGRIKQRKSVIGSRFAGHDTLTGIVDVAMISSFGKPGSIDNIVKNYGLVLIDECHHCASDTAEAVVKELSAKYIYGLTATPKRNDGQEQKIYMQLGSIRYRFSAKDKLKLQGIRHYVMPRFTRLVNTGNEWSINEAYTAVRNSAIRNAQIVADVEKCINEGRTVLVLTKFKDHADLLFSMLRSSSDHIFLLKGGRSRKENEQIREQMKNIPDNESIILIAIGQYIGEGFNYPRLDTMMLTTPIAWQGNVEQYSGRLHRDYAGKKDVVIFDYVDIHIRVFDKMYHKRMRAYKKIGYEIVKTHLENPQVPNSIFDSESYANVFEFDLQHANNEIIVSSPHIGLKGVQRFLNAVRERHDAGVRITVLTLPPDNYSEKKTPIISSLLCALSNDGITVQTKSGLHERYAILDNNIVWYGSVNFLSTSGQNDNLMRIQSPEIAQELMEISV